MNNVSKFVLGVTKSLENPLYIWRITQYGVIEHIVTKLQIHYGSLDTDMFFLQIDDFDLNRDEVNLLHPEIMKAKKLLEDASHQEKIRILTSKRECFEKLIKD